MHTIYDLQCISASTKRCDRNNSQEIHQPYRWHQKEVNFSDDKLLLFLRPRAVSVQRSLSFDGDDCSFRMFPNQRRHDERCCRMSDLDGHLEILSTQSWPYILSSSKTLISSRFNLLEERSSFSVSFCCIDKVHTWGLPKSASKVVSSTQFQLWGSREIAMRVPTESICLEEHPSGSISFLDPVSNNRNASSVELACLEVDHVQPRWWGLMSAAILCQLGIAGIRRWKMGQKIRCGHFSNLGLFVNRDLPLHISLAPTLPLSKAFWLFFQKLLSVHLSMSLSWFLFATSNNSIRTRFKVFDVVVLVSSRTNLSMLQMPEDLLLDAPIYLQMRWTSSVPIQRITTGSCFMISHQECHESDHLCQSSYSFRSLGCRSSLAPAYCSIVHVQINPFIFTTHVTWACLLSYPDTDETLTAHPSIPGAASSNPSSAHPQNHEQTITGNWLSMGMWLQSIRLPKDWGLKSQKCLRQTP